MKTLLVIPALLLLLGTAGAAEPPADANEAPPPDPVPEVVPAAPSAPDHRADLESAVFRREDPVSYEAAGHRDPFRALIVDEKKEGEIETDLLRLDGALLTGVVWSGPAYLAMVKDKDGITFFLREGDPVYSGRVTSIAQSQVSFEVSDFGDYDQVTLKIKRGPRAETE